MQACASPSCRWVFSTRAESAGRSSRALVRRASIRSTRTLKPRCARCRAAEKKKPAHRSETGSFMLSPFGENLAVRTATRLEAIAAVDRLVATRLERHGGLPAAVAASHFEHLALGARSPP